MPRAAGEEVERFLHADVGGEGGEFGFEDAVVLGRFVVFVFWELGPEAAENAEAGAGEVGDGAVFWGGMEGAEDELGLVHAVVEVVKKLRFPRCGLGGLGGGCGGHGAAGEVSGELGEAEERFGRYGCERLDRPRRKWSYELVRVTD